jgi:hypothetical protein
MLYAKCLLEKLIHLMEEVRKKSITQKIGKQPYGT